jgi:hypothetical protein
MSTSDTSIGDGPDRGGNEPHGNADGRGNKTLGEQSSQVPPAGNELLDPAAPDLPAGVPGAQQKPDAAKAAAEAFPDGPNVEDSPWELDAARGKPHTPGQ